MRWAPYSRVALLPRSRPLRKVPATRPSWYLPGRVPAALGQEGGNTWKHDPAAPCLAVRSAPTLSKHAGSSFFPFWEPSGPLEDLLPLPGVTAVHE